MSFKARAAALGLTVAPPVNDGSSARQIDLTVTGTFGDSAYGLGALRGLVGDIEHAGQVGGRDNTFNRACLRAGELIRRGDLTRATAEHALRQAGLAVSDDHDFTEYKVDEKIGRVIDEGISAGYRTKRGPAPDPIPDLPTFTPQPPPPDVPAEEIEAFWQSRPVLGHLRTFARSRMCSPWAVLGVALARVVVTAPAYYVLPPIVGSYASLNLFVALVGASGGGKGAAESAAGDALTLPVEVYTATVGSGEGIGHLYAHREKGEVIRDREAVLFTVPEVDNLVALGARQGATLMPQLRSAWSGEKLGFSYANKDKALPLDKHSYRMGLVLGVQPGRAQPLLDDADGGTPQRFLWLPTSDLDAPDALPAAPNPLTVNAPWLGKPVFACAAGLRQLTVCQLAVTTIVDARRDRLRGKGDALDGHALLARLKTAAALALLDGRLDVTDDDWSLSGLILRISDHTRASVVRHLANVTARSNQAKGIAEGVRATQVEDAVEHARRVKTAATLGRRLKEWPDQDGWASLGKLKAKLDSERRKFFLDALDALKEAGQVESRVTDKGFQQVRWVVEK